MVRPKFFTIKLLIKKCLNSTSYQFDTKIQRLLKIRTEEVYKTDMPRL
jgi:hypothetical protein